MVDKVEGPNTGASANMSGPDLATQLAQALKEKNDAAEALAQKEKEAKMHQQRADRLQHQQEMKRSVLPQPAVGQGQGQGQGQKIEDPGLARLQELEEAANKAARDNMILRELAARGLKETDLVDADIDVELCESPVELKLALDNLVMKRQLQDVDKWRTESKNARESGTPPSGPKIDAGGVSAESGEQADNQLQGLYSKSKELGRTQEAQWLRLRAIHNDPKKVMSPGSQE